MKNNILIYLLLLTPLSLFGQEDQSPSLLETDTTWSKEIFHLPINFAKDINYEGIEDARFPKGWSKKAVFRFSPKEFGNDVWLKLKAVQLRANICDF